MNFTRLMLCKKFHLLGSGSKSPSYRPTRLKTVLNEVIMSTDFMGLIATNRADIYAGWIGFGNLGDEAMYEICRERFPSVSWSTFNQLSYRPDGVQWLRRGATDTRNLFRGFADEVWRQPRLRKLAAQGAHGFVKLL